MAKQTIELFYALFDSAFHTSGGQHWCWYASQLNEPTLKRFYYEALAPILNQPDFDLPDNPDRLVRGHTALDIDWLVWYRLLDGGRDLRGRPGRLLIPCVFGHRLQIKPLDTEWLFASHFFRDCQAYKTQPPPIPAPAALSVNVAAKLDLSNLVAHTIDVSRPEQNFENESFASVCSIFQSSAKLATWNVIERPASLRIQAFATELALEDHLDSKIHSDEIATGGAVESIAFDPTVKSLVGLRSQILEEQQAEVALPPISTLDELSQTQSVGANGLASAAAASISNESISSPNSTPDESTPLTSTTIESPSTESTQPEPAVSASTFGLLASRTIRWSVVTIGVVLVGLFIVNTAGRWRKEREARESIQAAVEKTLGSDIADMPERVARLRSHRSIVLDYLHEAFASNDPRRKLSSAVALLTMNRGDAKEQAEFVASQLPNLSPAHLQHMPQEVFDCLKPEAFWEKFDADEPATNTIQLGAILARIDSNSEKWDIPELQQRAIAVLNAANEEDLVTLKNLYRPIGIKLLPELLRLAEASQTKEQLERCFDLLHTYQAKDYPLLAEVLLRFPIPFEPAKFEAIIRHEDSITSQLVAILSRAGSMESPNIEQKVKAALILLNLGKLQEMKSIFSSAEQADIANEVVSQIASAGIDPDLILIPFSSNSDQSIQRQLTLSIGQLYDQKQLKDVQRDQVLRELEQRLQTETDAGRHSAMEWLIRKIDAQRILPPNGSETGSLRDGFGWYSTRTGADTGLSIKMSLIAPPELVPCGSPENEVGRDEWDANLELVPIELPYFMSAHEVTVGQYQLYRSDYAKEFRRKPDARHPVLYITWQDAAGFCNWLSEQEGLPADQYCYAVSSENASSENASLLIPKPDHHLLEGYRLPRECEWECATRAGTRFARCFGDNEALLPEFAWYQHTAKWPQYVGLLKPNPYGLFDVYGNVAEWCEPCSCDIIEADKPPQAAIRGGGYQDPATSLRSASRKLVEQSTRSAQVGFRVARTVVLRAKSE